MKLRARQFIVGLILLPLAACQSYSLQELRQATPRGNEFQQALAREYLELASEDERNYNWSGSWHFADKGLAAAYGSDVGPENVSDWNIPEEHRAELEKARDDLLTALRPEVVEANPLLAARAYRNFDCWVERQEGNWETARIDACKHGFDDAMNELRNATQPKVTSAGAGKAGVDTTSYIVFFEWNRATLSKGGTKVISDVADSLNGESGYEVVLNGHTDTTGLEKYNLALSKKRAEAVAAALEARGVTKEAIKIFAFGESDPRVPSADGVDEPQNRRVEIFIQ